ncbi:hypothetical protein ABK040_003490 [Willaertia magna]
MHHDVFFTHFRTSSLPITNLSDLGIVYHIAVDSNNIIIVVGQKGIYGINGNDGSVVWKNTDLTLGTNGITLVNEYLNNSLTTVAYITSSSRYVAKIHTLSGKLIYKTFSPNSSRVKVGSQNVYALSGPVYQVNILNKEDGKYNSFFTLEHEGFADFYFCSEAAKINNNLVFYCLSNQPSTYLFSLDINPTDGQLKKKYSVKYQGNWSGNVLVLQNNDYVVRGSQGQGYIKLDFETGNIKQAITPVSDNYSICRAVTANNNMLYICCRGNNSGYCQSVSL